MPNNKYLFYVIEKGVRIYTYFNKLRVKIYLIRGKYVRTYKQDKRDC